MSDIKLVDATQVAKECYRDIGKYVAETRVYTSTVDGLKTGQRRLLYACSQHTSKTKSAVLVGDTLKYHPHGDGAVYGTLVSMACKYGRFPLFETQGNFGGLGTRSAAMRYTGALLSPLARKMLFSLVDYAEYREGDVGYMEPKRLPALLPYALLVGSGGIPVGLPGATIPSVDSLQLLDYFVAKLKGEEGIVPLPDFGACIINQDVASAREVIAKGEGKLWFRGMITEESEGKFVISDGTPKKDVNSVLKELKYYIDNDIIDYTDESGDEARYVFEIYDKSKITPKELHAKIDKALKCSVSYKYIFVDSDETAVYCGLDYVVNSMLQYLKECTIRKYTDYRDKAMKKSEILRIIKEFKASGKIADMHKMTQDEVATFMTTLGNGHEFKICKEATTKPMSYLTRSHDEEIAQLETDINQYDLWVNQPELYLLQLYAELRVMVEKLHKTKTHSVVGNLEDIQSQQYYAELEGTRVKILTQPTENSVEVKQKLLIVRPDGSLDARVAPKVEGSVIDLEYTPVGLTSDTFKYVLVVDKTRTHYVVHKVSDIKNKWKYSNEEYDLILSYNQDSIQILNIKGKLWDLVFEDQCQEGRRSKSRNVRKMIRIDGEER